MQTFQCNFSTDKRGRLTAFDFNDLPFTPVRVFLVRGRAGAVRGGHGHMQGHQLLIATRGQIDIEARAYGASVALRLSKTSNAVMLSSPVWAKQTYLNATAPARVLRYALQSRLICSRPGAVARRPVTSSVETPPLIWHAQLLRKQLEKGSNIGQANPYGCPGSSASSSADNAATSEPRFPPPDLAFTRQTQFLDHRRHEVWDTSLYNALCTHPRVAPALRKEVHFFDYPDNYAKGIRWYRTHFPLAWSGKITGEASPYYSFHPLAPERTARHAPKAKLLLLVRDPVVRAFRHHRHETRLKFEYLPFDAAISAEAERLDGEAQKILADTSYYSYAHQHWSYATRGHYIDAIDRWRKHFPDNQLRVVVLERLLENTRRELGHILDFLCLESAELDLKKRDERPAQMSAATRSLLRSRFAASNAHLAARLGCDLPWG